MNMIEYLKDCTCMKSLLGDPVVVFAEIVYSSESTWIYYSNEINYLLIAVDDLLVVVCLLVLMVIIVKYYC